MSGTPDARKISVATVIDNAIPCIEGRRVEGKTMTASYFVEYEDVRFVITINPAIDITNIVAGRQSIQ